MKRQLKRGGKVEDMSGRAVKVGQRQAQVDVLARRSSGPKGVQESSIVAGKRARGPNPSGLPPAWGSLRSVGEPLPTGLGRPQPAGPDTPDAEIPTDAKPTTYKPQIQTPRQRFKRAVLESWMATKNPLTKVITIVNRPPKKAGELFGNPVHGYLFACPACAYVGGLEHDVILLQDAITMSPSLECPMCGWHGIIQGWTLRYG